MTIDLVEEFAAAITAGATSVRYGSGDVLTLPWSMADGESVAVYVEQVADDSFFVTDRGLAADVLAMAGVDLSRGKNTRSWEGVRASLTLPPAMMVETSEFELAGSASRRDLGAALTAVGEAVLRADGLRVLGQPRRNLTFPERVIKHASENDLTVLPKAKMRTKFGGERVVTCRIEGSSSRWAFVQALSAGSQGNNPYDHVRSVFGDAAESREHLLTVVADIARLQSWQETALDEISTVTREAQQAAVWKSYAA